MGNEAYVQAGIAEGFNLGTKNLFSIMEKKRERKQEDELFGLKKKAAELKIKELELTGLDPETIQLEKDKLKAEVDLQKAKAATADLTLEDARKTTQERLKDLKDQANVIRTFDQGRQRGQQDALQLPGAGGGVATQDQGGLNLPRGWSVDYTLGEDPEFSYKTPEDKKLTVKQQRDVSIEKQQALTALKQGYYTETEKGKQYAYDFTDRGMAENYLISNTDVDINDPDIQQALGQYKGAEDTIDMPNWFERTFGTGQQRPQKQKFGFTWEQQDDKTWKKLK